MVATCDDQPIITVQIAELIHEISQFHPLYVVSQFLHSEANGPI